MTKYSSITAAGGEHADQIRVMLVDDSAVARAVLSRILGSDDRVSLSFSADSSASALAFLAQEKVDIVLLDIEMPSRSGLEALPDIIAAASGAKVVIVSSHGEENGPPALKALELGAADTLAKPGKRGLSGTFAKTLLEKIIRLGRSEPRTSRHFTNALSQANIVELSKPDIIAIGASTGGIPAIFTLVRGVDLAVSCPILITQHLPTAFMTFFVKQLSELTNRKVLLAEDGMRVAAGHIYVAPGDAHLGLRRVRGRLVIQLLENYHASRYCPSVDAMFESVADTASSSALAIVLSGMGSDGIQGAHSLAAMNAQIIIQDEDSSVVWGMPGTVARAGLAQATLTPEQMVQAVNRSAIA